MPSASQMVARNSGTVNGSVATVLLNDGDTIKWAAYDNVGNVQAVQSDLIQIDSTKPTNSFSIGSASGASFGAGPSRLYFSSSAAGSFTISDALADSNSGPDSVVYPAIATSGTPPPAATHKR